MQVQANHNRQKNKKSLFALYAFTACILTGAPLLGVVMTGQPLARYLEFPPLTRYVPHAPFNGAIFTMGAVVFILVMLFVVLITPGSLLRQRDRKKRKFPWWGWVGILVVVCSWILAWNRFSWFAGLQAYTFTPLWLGYILSVNGIIWKRSGTCLITRCPGRFLLLFPVSALFWWYFEWLNRFVQNWYYVGVEDFSTLGYLLHATICFSTVLPALISTCELLMARMPEPVVPGPRLRFLLRVRGGWLLLAGMTCVLTGLALAPDLLFPFVWIAPLVYLSALQLIHGRQTIFTPLVHGNWRPVLIPAMAALICGFFWELWNWKSLAHWQYSIPYVDCYHLFAMPIIGYLGYLPFGLMCQVLVADFIQPVRCGNRDSRI